MSLRVLEPEPDPGKERVSPMSLLFGLGAILVCGLLFQAMFRGSSRPLYLVNGTGDDARVTIRGVGIEEQVHLVPAGQVVPCPLGEGKYQLQVEHRWGRANHDLTMTSGLSERVGEARTVFVLNIASAGALLRAEEEYRSVLHPDTEEWQNSGSANLLSGGPLLRVENVHFPFVPWPEKIPAKTGQKDRLTRLSVLNGIPRDVLSALPKKVPAEEVLCFLETQLRVDPTPATFQLYEKIAKEERAMERRNAFLRALDEAAAKKD